MSVTIHLLTPSYCMISFRSPHRHCKTTRSQSSSHSPCCYHSLCCHQSPYCTHSLHNRHSRASHTRHSRPMPSPCRNLRVSDGVVTVLHLRFSACAHLHDCCSAAHFVNLKPRALDCCLPVDMLCSITCTKTSDCISSNSDSMHNVLLQRRAWASSS